MEITPPPPQQQPQQLSPRPTRISVNGNNHSGVSTEELQDTSAILFTETSRIELRDPRLIADSLEGVLTPRNEAGPFVFD